MPFVETQSIRIISKPLKAEHIYLAIDFTIAFSMQPIHWYGKLH